MKTGKFKKWMVREIIDYTEIVKINSTYRDLGIWNIEINFFNNSMLLNEFMEMLSEKGVSCDTATNRHTKYTVLACNESTLYHSGVL